MCNVLLKHTHINLGQTITYYGIHVEDTMYVLENYCHVICVHVFIRNLTFRQ